METYNLTSFSPQLFILNGWLDEPYKIFKYIYLSIWAIIIAFPLVTASRILFINFFFLLDLRHIPIIPIPNLLRMRLRDLTSLYLTISFLWFIGVSLFAIMFFNDVDVVSLIVIAILSIFGIITFLTPQIIYHQLLKRSENIASRWILSSFYKKLEISLIEENDNNYIQPLTASQTYKLDSLVDYLDASIPVKRWVYSQTQIISFLLAQLFTLFSPKIINELSRIFG
jgi:hypothetical protein